jgi:hypothetical protein
VAVPGITTAVDGIGAHVPGMRQHSCPPCPPPVLTPENFLFFTVLPPPAAAAGGCFRGLGTDACGRTAPCTVDGHGALKRQRAALGFAATLAALGFQAGALGSTATPAAATPVVE